MLVRVSGRFVSGVEAVMRWMYEDHVRHGTPVILAGDFNLTSDDVQWTMESADREWGAMGSNRDFILPCTHLRG